MNIVIENKNADIIDSLNIAAIEKLSGEFDITELFTKISSLQYEKVILDITSLKVFNDIKTFQSLISFIPSNKLILVIGTFSIPKEYLANIIEVGIYNIAYNANHIVELYSSPNSYEDAIVLVNNASKKTRIIGFKNVTKHAGATTLIYILKKHLENIRKVMAVEVDKMDFNFFYSQDMIATPENSLELTINKYSNYDIIFIDINQSKKALEYCDEVIYLIEPTMIKVNQSMMVDPTMFSSLKNEKVILNKSPLDHNDTKEFETEAHLKVFYSLPLINERKKNNQIINELINKLKL